MSHFQRFAAAVALISLAGVAAGCGGKDAKKTEEPPAKAPVKDFEGKLTVDLLSKANRAVQVYDASGTPANFDDAMSQARQVIGKPTKSDGNSHAWGLIDGDKCSYYMLVNKDGKAESSGFRTVDKAAGKMHTKCLTAIGKM